MIIKSALAAIAMLAISAAVLYTAQQIQATPPSISWSNHSPINCQDLRDIANQRGDSGQDLAYRIAAKVSNSVANSGNIRLIPIPEAHANIQACLGNQP